MTDADAMTQLLAGWLLGTTDARGRDFMKIVRVQAAPPDAFFVTFASGLRLRVTVAEQAPAPPRAALPGALEDDGK